MKSSLKNMVLVLFVITAVTSSAVGVVYNMTKDPIEKADQLKTQNALSEVLPKFDNQPNDEKIEKDVDGMKLNVYTARLDGKVVGYAVETFSKNGFNGHIRLIVGFKTDGSIHNISVLSQNETPGLGAKISEKGSKFVAQFSGKNPDSFKLFVKKDGGDVDAITASTITSRAFTEAVNLAYKIFNEIDKEEADNE
jgi:electron transport complex protein RnfG